MYEIDVSVYNHSADEQIKNFLDLTKNFGKRFYNVDYYRREARIRVTALAVSRDLTYILRWSIKCNRSTENVDDWPFEDLVEGNLPPYGWEPKYEEEKNIWWPYYHKKKFFDVFKLNGFIWAEDLKKDGVSIVNWNDIPD